MTKKVENAYDYVIDVAKPGGFELFGMVKPPGPIYTYIRLVFRD